MTLLEQVRKAFFRTISGYFRLLIVSMGLIGMVLFSVFTYFEISNAREFALKSFEQTVLLETNYITHWFEDNASRVRTLSQLPSVRRGDLTTFFQRVELFAKNSPHITGITFVNANGIAVSGEDVSDREYFKRAKHREEYISDALQGRSSKEWIVVFSAPVFNDKEEFLGAVVSAVKLDALVQAMEEFHLGATGETYLISDSGMRISSSRLSLPSDSKEVPWKGPSVEFLYGTEQGKIISGVFENAKGESVLGAYGSLDKSRWIVAGEINEYEILESVYNKILIAGLISIGLGILVLYSTAFFSRRINQPIAILVGQTQKIELGKLQLLPETGMLPEESPRELVEIYRAFQTMARQLIEDIQELDWVNAKLTETEERFRVLAESSMVGVYIIDEKGKANYVNPRLCEMLGYSAREMEDLGCIMELIHSEDKPAVERCFEGRKNNEMKANMSYEFRVVSKAGEIIHADIYSTVCYIDEKWSIIGTLIDKTQQKQWEKMIYASERKNKAIINAIPDTLLRLDAAGTVQEIITYPKNGKKERPEEWLESMRELNCFFIEKLFASGEMQHYEHEFLLKGERKTKEIRMVSYGDNEILLLIRDITERKVMEEQLKHLSYHDALTGLYNRAYLDEHLTDEKLQNKRPVGIIVADVDGLKQVNDKLGHQLGDRLLQKAASILRSNENHIVARVGGDEFVVLLTQTSEEEIKILCNEIEEKIDICNQGGGEVPLHISLGWSIGDEDMPIHEVFREADDAMYWNKSVRKERVQRALCEQQKM
nr:diguanylate cyclase [uncultured Anaeromusa sp.]